MAIKNRLKEIRMKEYMLQQNEFAEQLQVDISHYNRWENNRMQPSSEMMFIICKRLQKSIEEVFYRADD
jgi:DNA-binding XRE family transcriptional regulator